MNNVQGTANAYVPESLPPTLGQTFRKTSSGKIIGHHPSIQEAVHTLDRVAPSDCTVLVTGESGTGKELVVAALHDASRRARGPLVVVNCGAIPDNLIEAELFGYKRGAFTGATHESIGRVGAAEGGTLFLDEIGDLPMQMQVKLLRLLQNRESTQIGATTPRYSDVRVVAATHKNLKELVREGKLREDLYFRINVVHVGLPALRERGEDIEVLANYFLKQFSVQVGRAPPAGFSPDALEAMRRYPWPGNIRELENAVHRAVLLSAGPLIALRDLPPPVRAVMDDHTDEHAALSPRASVTAPALLSAPPPPMSSASVAPSDFPTESTRGEAPEATLPATGTIDLRQIIEDYENSLIMQAMARTNNNKNRAAQLLGLNRTTLVEMIKRKKLFPINSPHSDKD
jgi:sigma-54 specific flagellar transcriptional regulator A